jgi:hypothetical protein
MARLELTVGGNQYSGDLVAEAAPESVEALETFLPHESELMHVRWSGHAVWVNIDEVELPELPRENHTVYPSRGDVLLYPGFRNEQEILLACGPTCFKSPAGELAGNHVATLDASAEELRELEELTLQEGVQDVAIQLTE